MSSQVIVVGGGLSGLSAIHTVLEHGGNVLLLDKNAFLGGNSTKATSGINGAGTKTQRDLNIQDTPETFYEDTAKSARGKLRPPLAKVLTFHSGSAVEWLQTAFNLDLSLVSRLGGHSFPRTHRGKERFPGMTITYALMEKFEEITKNEPNRARVQYKARVTRLLTEGSAVIGVEYEKDGKSHQEYGPVIIATGGYAADFSENSLLRKYRPDICDLATTNGDHCTGDGIKIACAIGANTADMTNVQVHPTGLVDPAEPDAKVKFLAAEALRGVGGLLLTADGKRFCDELGHRDYVTGEMWKNKGPFRLVLNGAATREIEWHCKHYSGRGLMKRFDSGESLAKEMGINPKDLEETFNVYNEIAKAKKDPYGKKFFHNTPIIMKDEFYVSIVTPVVHYCMGGLEVNEDSAVLGTSGGAIQGLWAAGEVMGGVHGENRLGGSSLLDCVVFGRVSGGQAAKYLLQNVLKQSVSNVAAKRVANIAGQLGTSVPSINVNQQTGAGVRIDVDPISKRVSLEIGWGGEGAIGTEPEQQPGTSFVVPKEPDSGYDSSDSSAASQGSGSGQKFYSMEEVAKHNTEKDCWVTVNGEVLDVTKFLPDHPGGKKAILIYAGRDATEEFNMLHKPDVVEKYAPYAIIGKVGEGGNSSDSGSSSGSGEKFYSMEDVAKHNTEKDCWVTVNGEVLDVTKFLPDHPGGKKAILIYAGRDATEEFNMLHKPDVVAKYAPYAIIGKVAPGSSSSTSHSAPSAPAPTENKTTTGVTTSGTVARIVPQYEKVVASNVESRNSGGTADILPAERKKATFDVLKLTNFLDGGAEMTKKRRFILSPTKNIDLSDKYNWERSDYLKNHVKHFIETHEDFWGHYKPTREEVSWMMEGAMLSGSLMNHYGLFLATLDAQGTEEQKAWWVNRSRRMQMVGCYAQTELGHGSNVRGLMTTAEYDKSSQEFILNTPTLKSIKWWPGALAKVATHASVYAQLLIDGKEYGVHSFIVQIRDENHLPIKGIELGDLGPKLGDHANDTGYMRLDNVRIPREFMLARFQHVTPEGEYVKSEMSKKNAKLHYATMMFTRGAMVKASGGYLARAVTIAMRYSCVRKQGFIDTSKTTSFKSAERSIIDYQVQRFRIFKQLAFTYAIKFTGRWMLNRFRALEDTSGPDKKSLGKIEALPEIAATSAGLKALCTIFTSQGIEDCRKCCGGNGYLLNSGVASLAADYVWQTTAEGDFVILMLQTARFLLKALRDAMAGKAVAGPVSYLAPLKDMSSFNLLKAAPPAASHPAEFKDLSYLLKLYQYASLVAVVGIGEQFQKSLAAFDNKFDEAWNRNALELTNAVRSHTLTFLMSNFVLAANEVEDPAVKSVLTKLCALFATTNIVDDPQWTGILSVDQVRLAKAALVELLEELRPDGVALVDAFDIPDNVLNSTIGRADGNVYEALFEAATKSPLNRSDPFDGYEEYLRPHLDLEFLKLGNNNPSASKL